MSRDSTVTFERFCAALRSEGYDIGTDYDAALILRDGVSILSPDSAYESRCAGELEAALNAVAVEATN